MGAMEWGVTGGSVPPAAASEETRHRVARARGQFLDTSSMGAMEWDRDGLERGASPQSAARARAQARSVLGHFFHGGHGMGRNGWQRTACSGHQETRRVASHGERAAADETPLSEAAVNTATPARRGASRGGGGRGCYAPSRNHTKKTKDTKKIQKKEALAWLGLAGAARASRSATGKESCHIVDVGVKGIA